MRLREKSGKRHAMPCHHNLQEIPDRGIVNLSGRGMLLVSVARQLGVGELLCSPIVLPRSSRAGPEKGALGPLS